MTRNKLIPIKKPHIEPKSSTPASVRKARKSDCSRSIDQLMSADVRELRARYSDIFKQQPPSAFGPDLLRRSIAHQIQCKEHGGLSAHAQKLLRAVVKHLQQKPNDPIEIKRRIKVGSELIRTWKGKAYRVVVSEGGYQYGDKVYLSLSEIASEITGTNWNGPRFFGLRSNPSKKSGNGK